MQAGRLLAGLWMCSSPDQSVGALFSPMPWSSYGAGRDEVPRLTAVQAEMVLALSFLLHGGESSTAHICLHWLKEAVVKRPQCLDGEIARQPLFPPFVPTTDCLYKPNHSLFHSPRELLHPLSPPVSFAILHLLLCYSASGFPSSCCVHTRSDSSAVSPPVLWAGAGLSLIQRTFLLSQTVFLKG